MVKSACRYTTYRDVDLEKTFLHFRHHPHAVVGTKPQPIGDPKPIHSKNCPISIPVLDLPRIPSSLTNAKVQDLVDVHFVNNKGIGTIVSIATSAGFVIKSQFISPNYHSEKIIPSNKVFPRGAVSHYQPIQPKSFVKYYDKSSYEKSEPSLFQTTYFQQPVEEIVCSICFDVLKSPIQTNCGHSFCSECIDSVRKHGSQNCPECRTVLEQKLTDDLRLKRTIAKLKVKCSKECLFEIEFGVDGKNLKQHLESCPFAMTDCQYYGCQEVIQRSKLEEHHATCIWRPVECPHCHHFTQQHHAKAHLDYCPLLSVSCPAKCGSLVARSETESHEQTCANALQSCSNKEYGCKQQIPRYMLQEHEKTCQFRCLPCQYGCEYVTFSHLLDKHYKSNCKFYPLDCQECGAKGIRRASFAKHQEEECFRYSCLITNCKQNCKFSKRQLEQHNQQYAQDHVLALQTVIQSQQESFTKLLQRVNRLEEQQTQTQSMAKKRKV